MGLRVVGRGGPGGVRVVGWGGPGGGEGCWEGWTQWG